MPHYNRNPTFIAFRERRLSEYLTETLTALTAKIEGENENYILNVNETDYKDHLFEQFNVSQLEFYFEKAFLKDYETQISAESLSILNTFFGNTISRNVFVYHLPFEGDSAILRCEPNSTLLWNPEAFIEGKELCFEIMDLSQNSDDINRELDGLISNLKTQLNYINLDIKNFNTHLSTQINSLFQTQKQKFLDKNKLRAALNIPFKRKDDFPQTFAVPTPQIVKKFHIRPVVTENGYTPDPTLDIETYNFILQTIHELGKVMERAPSIYEGKEEENIRDLFLLYITPRIQGEVTGETFNKRGRTDILIRYQNSNLFIAECKFWDGSKEYLKAISQILTYLTWRDSKAAVIMFVKNKEFSIALSGVETHTSDHPNYLGFVNKKDESWFNFRFHINGDKNREVKLAVLLFHFP